MTRTRDTTNPGSCPANYTFNASMPARVTADPSQPSGYNVEIGYSSSTGSISYTSCTNNIVGCRIFATCNVYPATDQITLDVTGNAISGTVARTTTDCSGNGTVNFDVTGTRQ